MQDEGGLKTWHDCYKCWHMFHNHTHCTGMAPPRPFDGCHPDVLDYVQVSNYAAQLAWWLAFFPPEQILILTSAELRDPARQVQVSLRPLPYFHPHRYDAAHRAHSADLSSCRGDAASCDRPVQPPTSIAVVRRRKGRTCPCLQPHVPSSGFVVEELRPCMQALNRILDHANLPNARRFTRKWLDSMSVPGFVGKYAEKDTARGVPEAVATLRQRFRKPVEDLKHLINRFWPHMNFTGLPDEV